MSEGAPSSLFGSSVRSISSEGWSWCSTTADECHSPDELVGSENVVWSVVRLPCTVGSALASPPPGSYVGGNEGDTSIEDRDHWFRCEFAVDDDTGRPSELVFHGLATICEIWLNDEKLGESINMFVRTDIDVSEQLRPQNVLMLCFRALGPRLRLKHPRARWRTQLVTERNLRFYRTSLQGRTSATSLVPPAVGPWRPIELVTRPRTGLRCHTVSLVPAIERDAARLTVDVILEIGSTDPGADGERLRELRFEAEVEGQRWPLSAEVQDDSRLRVHGTGGWPAVERWWPHTHGRPRRYAVSLRVLDGDRESEIDLGMVGFREIELVGPPGDDFRLEINGQRVFCRGTCWNPIEPVSLGSRPGRLRCALEQARDAGMNMLRVTGTSVYEDDAFYSLCDQLGIMVWQDFMFATLDYPAQDDAFMATVATEVEQFLERTARRPCLAVLCGSSEYQQQPAMLGLDRASWSNALFDEVLPTICARDRPDVPYWRSTPSSPDGGALPFHVQAGTSHYFGVGAYRRPLEDARLARPRFITECLAFANVAGVEGSDPSLPERVPRDRGASWDFMDVTDHYLEKVFGEDALLRARQDDAFAADLRRATSAEIMQRTQSIWRDPRSGCNGSLVLTHRDVNSGPGWGVIDDRGCPKAAYYGLMRAFQPVAIAILDEGLNGLRWQIHNDGDTAIEGEVEIVLMRVDGTRVRECRKPVVAPARSSIDQSVDVFFGGFVDSSYAYRFGAREFEISVARLYLADAKEPLETIHWPFELGLLEEEPVGLRVEWVESAEESATLEIRAERFVRCLGLDVQGGLTSDNFFPLAPDRGRRIRIRAIDSLGVVATAGVKEELAGRVTGRACALDARQAVAIPERQISPPPRAARSAEA